MPKADALLVRGSFVRTPTAVGTTVVLRCNLLLIHHPMSSHPYADCSIFVSLDEQRGRQSVRPPMLLTHLIGFDRMIFAYEHARRTFFGIQVRCSQQVQTQADELRTPGLGNPRVSVAPHTRSRTRGRATQETLQNQRVSHFLRGAGLASLFQDVGRMRKQLAQSPTNLPDTSPFTSHWPNESRSTEHVGDAQPAEAPNPSVLAFASVKLPHVSPPTFMLLHSNPKSLTGTAVQKEAKNPVESLTVLSAAPEGFFLIWEYSLACSPEALEQAKFSGGLYLQSKQPKNLLREDCSSQSCFPEKEDKNDLSLELEPDFIQRERTLSPLTKSSPLTSHPARADLPKGRSLVAGAYGSGHQPAGESMHISRRSSTCDDFYQEQG